MYKIAVMGGNDTVIGFKALGLDTFPISSSEEASEVFRQLTKTGSNYAIIYIEEDLASGLLAEIAEFKESVTPAIILIPGRDGPLRIGQTALRDAVRRAVGTDI